MGFGVTALAAVAQAPAVPALLRVNGYEQRRYGLTQADLLCGACGGVFVREPIFMRGSIRVGDYCAVCLGNRWYATEDRTP